MTHDAEFSLNAELEARADRPLPSTTARARDARNVAAAAETEHLERERTAEAARKSKHIADLKGTYSDDKKLKPADPFALSFYF